ncbi:MAG: hypothetical protein CMK83_15105 [Pseudomonadales bacterium]|jgi:tetratricopeptide (TPR) repeat protein|nr:hypothetical protein [Pseudomonadales bacterium]MBI25767.1 hypothetical protein [Pseudomonadales bacterium]TNC90419.1 MAG: hypothetical protein CSH49_02915 [Alcanivorax sp.]HAG94207.1 hypothetical protein [Gammaproteobacteria bacterium]HAU12174.1 hypothetical protein [Gammaproteobacteria bacterium]|tara:strand:- start:5870 stop:8320 length:2451 start_codon:yes stop_codon:yes gene_type:complete
MVWALLNSDTQIIHMAMITNYIRTFCIILLFGVTLSGCDGQESRKQKYLTEAEQSFLEQDYEKARINYKNVLKIDPKDVNGLMGFARTLEKLADWRGAVGRYRAVLEIEPDNVEAKVKLGQLYLMANEYSMAMELAETILAGEPTSVAGLTLKAGAVAKEGNVSKALGIVEQAHKLDKHDLDATVLYSSLLVANNRAAEGLSVLEKALDVWPDSITLHSMLANYYLSKNQLILAEEELKRLTQIAPENVAFKHKLVLFYERTGREQEAEKIYREIIASGENQTEAIIALHDLYMMRKNQEKAKSTLEEFIATYPDDFDLKFKLAEFYVNSKQYDTAESMYQSYLSENDSVSTRARTRLAYLMERQGKLDQAETYLADVLKEYPGNIDALTLRGKMYLDKEDAVNAISDLRTVLNANPENISILKALAHAYLLNENSDLAIQMLKAVSNLDPRDVQAHLQLAELYSASGKLEPALDQYKIADSLSPNNEFIKQKMASTYLAADASGASRELSLELMEMKPENPIYPLYTGLSYQIEGKHERAIDYFDQSLALLPEAIEPLSAKVRSLLALKQLDQASAWLAEVVKQQPNNAPAMNFKGEVHLAKQEYKAAELAFEQAVKAQSGWWLPYRNLTLAKMAVGDVAAAVDMLQLGIDKTGGDSRLKMELAMLYERQNKLAEALKQYESIVAADDDNVAAINNLVMVLIAMDHTDEGVQERAMRLGQKLLADENPLYKDTMGWLYYSKGDYDKALPLIRRALIAYPQHPEINFHLGMTYYKIAEFEKAEQYLRVALQDGAVFRGKSTAEETLVALEEKLSAL